ncbi:CheY-like superfamily [Aspergillus carlsbadensis]|nr:CheY-like superfamily [Aspergillus carlsbadensis]
MHILLAEDNGVNQKLFTRILTRLECTVSIANNGQEALDYLASSPATHRRPDIILMDVSMPVMGGIEATNIIRTQPPFATDPTISMTPIIAMTAHTLQAQINSGWFQGRGFDDVLQKPARVGRVGQLILYWSRRRVVPRQGALAVPHTGNMVPLPPAAVPWGISPLRAYRGPRSLL